MDSFHVIVEGHCLDGFDLTAVQTRLSQLMKISEDRAATLLAGRDTRVKSGVDAATGERYLVALRAVGVACRLEGERLEFDAIHDAPQEPAPVSPPRAAGDSAQSRDSVDRAAGEAAAAPKAATKASPAVAIVQLLGSSLLVVVSIYFLWNAAAGFLGKRQPGALRQWFSGDSQAKSIADQILKGNLNSPGSYKPARPDVLWSKAMGDETAYVVRTEYDAQNGFGTLLRDCQYTSFTTTGDQFKIDRLAGMQPCADARDQPDWEEQRRRLVPILLTNAGLARFAAEATGQPAAPSAKPVSPAPAPAVAAQSTTVASASAPSGPAAGTALAYARSVAAQEGCVHHEDALEALTGKLSGIEGEIVVAAYSLEGCGGGNNWGQHLVVLQTRDGATRKLARAAGPSFEALKIVDGRLKAVASSYGPNDARCCPTLKGPVTYTIRGDSLVPVNEPAPTVASVASTPAILGPAAGAAAKSTGPTGGQPNLAAEMMQRYGASPNWTTCRRLNEFHVSDSGNGMTVQAWDKCININSDRANRGSLQVMCETTEPPRPKACAG